MGERVIKVDGPKPGQTEMSVDLNETKNIKLPSERDLQLYYFVLSNTMKNYKMYKDNSHLFRASCACDNCYQIFNVKDNFYKNEEENITLCNGCYEDNEAKEHYKKIEMDVSEKTGYKW